MIAPYSMEVDDLLNACLVIERRPGTDEFGEEIPEVDVNVMALEPSLVNGIYDILADSWFSVVRLGVRLWTRTGYVDGCRFVAAILDLFKLNFEVG